MQFKQSLSDFPVNVSLGEKLPSWGLSRWGGQGLRFVPSDDEGFTLRGDRKRLVYKGRRRSHRFTVLGDSSFEYDCILNKEPDSNVITLLMEGAEGFDFFRQPDFVSDPFLKGSFAVYKKETMMGEGTGKLCHIHRPLIIDARGRRVWGELAIVGNVLRITIPEQWLAGAVYPVIVDPTVGTTAVGSQYLYAPKEPLVFEACIPINRFLVSETINGNCTAYFYTNSDGDEDAGGRPVLYSDNGNTPLSKRSANEGFIDFRITSGKPVGWRSGVFNCNGNITGGSYIWFGCFTEYFWYPRFDYGSRCYNDFPVNLQIPNTYPLSNYFQDFKLSMYFNYTSGQNYIRTITQGVTLTDKTAFPVLFARRLTDTTKPECKTSSSRLFFLTLSETVQAKDVITRGLLLFVRIVSGLFARDYLLKRFLIAKEELILKSCIAREITLESKIN